MNQDEIKACVVLARNGDTAAFCRLYELYYKDMYRFAYYVLGNTHDAEDVISETVLDAFSGIRTLKHPSKFKAWIFRILSVKCRRQLGVYSSHRQQLSTDTLPEAFLTTDAPNAEDLDIRNAFMKLTDQERLILSLTLFAGYNSRETARMTESREGTVRSVKSRALARLSDYLKEDFA